MLFLPPVLALGSYVQVIASHGGSSHYDQLSTHFRIVRFDRSGTGLSAHVNEPLSLENMAHDLDALLESLPGDQMTLAAFRDGGPFAI